MARIRGLVLWFSVLVACLQLSVSVNAGAKFCKRPKPGEKPPEQCGGGGSQVLPPKARESEKEAGGESPTSLAVAAPREGEDYGEWDLSYDPNLASERCDIEKIDGASLTRAEFEERYLEKKPVILIKPQNNSLFQERTKKTPLLREYKDFIITLSTANANSYFKSSSKFSDYVLHMMEPQTLNVTGEDTKYHFGDNKHDEWKQLFDDYKKPEQFIFGKYASYSWGLGGSGTGVPFHTHGHVFAEVMWGRKRWFLQAPGPEPKFDPDASSLQWLNSVYPTLSKEEKDKILDCTCDPGDVLYIPTLWHHSTLNLGQTIFMSTFV